MLPTFAAWCEPVWELFSAWYGKIWQPPVKMGNEPLVDDKKWKSCLGKSCAIIKFYPGSSSTPLMYKSDTKNKGILYVVFLNQPICINQPAQKGSNFSLPVGRILS